MARYDREAASEMRHEPAALPFPDRTGHDFSTHPDRGGGTGGDDGGADHTRERLAKSGRELIPALRESEIATLTDIGTFWALTVEDLANYRYEGDQTATKRDLERLSQSGLIRRKTTHPERTVYATLTREGQRVIAARHREQGSLQRLYHGFVKPREAQHDAALYHLYQQESERIEGAGGRVRRVVLDFELKQSINRKLVKLNTLPKSKQDQEKQEIAASHGLKVVNGKIPLPDVRLEYEDPDHAIAKVDLELVTHHYHRENLAAKAKAGFAMYASAEDAVRLRPAMSDPEIMQEILSL